MEQQIQALEQQIINLEKIALIASKNPQQVITTLRYNKLSLWYFIYYITSLLDNNSVNQGEKRIKILIT